MLQEQIRYDRKVYEIAEKIALKRLPSLFQENKDGQNGESDYYKQMVNRYTDEAKYTIELMASEFRAAYYYLHATYKAAIDNPGKGYDSAILECDRIMKQRGLIP